MATPSGVKAREYWCFISYRHLDNRESGRQWATWLHQAIETYDVPADLVGTVNARGETIPARIFPVFRDEEELPVDADLTTAITHALENSKYLVVVCSPRAVQSTYVRQEIEYFQQLGHGDRILPAIIAGEPNASRDVGKHASGFSPQDECFPEPLVRVVADAGGRQAENAGTVEPIAADFRLDDSSEGWTSPEALRQALGTEGRLSPAEKSAVVEAYRKKCELMKLKIIAGILGVALGTLTKRDAAFQLALARKRARALRRWLGAVGLLAILAVGGGLLAWQKRTEAIAETKIADQQRRAAVSAQEESEQQRKIADQQRAEAVAARNESETQKKVAEEQRARALTTLSQYDFGKAGNLVSRTRERDAMACLARALREDPGNSAASTLAYNLILAQSHRPPALSGPLLLPDPVKFVEFSPGGTEFLTVSSGTGRDGRLQVWDAKTYAPAGPPITDKVDFNSEAHFSGDGRQVITSSPWHFPRLWDVGRGLQVGAPLGRISNGVEIGGTEDVATINDRNGMEYVLTLSTNLGNTLFGIWNGHTAELLESPDKKKQKAEMNLELPNTYGGLFNTAKFYAAIKTAPSTLVMWDLRANRAIGQPIVLDGTLVDYGFCPDGSKLLTRSIVNVGGKLVGQVGVWDTTTAAPVGAPISESDIQSAAFSPDGKTILLMSFSGGRLWDAATMEPEGDSYVSTQNLNFDQGSMTQNFNQFSSGMFSPDGHVVLGLGYGQFVFWDTATGAQLADAISPGVATGIASAAFSPDGTKILTAAGNAVQLWECAPPAGATAPDWLPDLAEAVAREKFTDAGEFVPVGPDQLASLGARLQNLQGDDFWSSFARWYFTDPWKRTISPHSRIATPDYVQQLMTKGTSDALDEAARLATGHPDVLAQIAAKRQAPK
jgi:WD40 repeat protein